MIVVISRISVLKFLVIHSVDIAFYGPGAIIRGLIPESRYFFRVRANNNLGSSEWSEYLLVSPTGGDFGNWNGVPEPTNSAATGSPSISGIPKMGETLTADVSDVVDDNGLDRVKFHYQWISSDGTDDTDIDGATDNTCTLRPDDEGKAVKVRVSFTDRGGYTESRTSATAEVEELPPNIGATCAPTITGAADSADDHGDNTETATELPLDTWIDGTLDRVDDVDIFRFTITEPSHIGYRILGPNHNPAIDEWTSTVSIWGHFFPPDGESEVSSTNGIHDAGTHYIRLFKYAGKRGPERYRLKAYKRQDQGDTIETAAPFSLSHPSMAGRYGNKAIVNSTFHSQDDVDFFKLQLESAANVRFLVSGQDNVWSIRLNPVRAGFAATTINVAQFDSEGNLVGTPFEGFPTTGHTYQLDTGTHYFRFSPFTWDNGETFLGRYFFYAVQDDDHGGDGICDRTEQVRDPILSHLKAQAITQCESVTDSHLSEIRGVLYLQDGRISEFKPDDFRGLSSLQGLFLENNNLGSLDDDVFDDLANLRVLSLASNDLSSLPDGGFDRLTELRALYLEHNSLSSLPEGVFDSLENLEVLSLVSNELESLPDGVFANLGNLRELYLGGNGLTELPDGMTVDLANLETVSFDDEDPPSPFNRRPATGLPAVIGAPVVGRTLRANTANIVEGNCWSGTRISIGDDEIVDYSYRWIAVDGTTETEITGATSSTYKLASADEGMTIKVSVSFTDCGGHDVTVTSASTTTVTSVPPASSGICYRSPKVRYVILSRLSEVNDCQDVTDAHLSGITGGMVLNGYITSGLWEGDFDGLTSLRELRISSIDLTGSLPTGLFDGLAGLEVLSITGTSLTSLDDGTFDGLSNLRKLRLSENWYLASLSEDIFDNLSNLERLDMYLTALEVLPEGIFDSLSSLKHLKLTGTGYQELTGDWTVAGLESLSDGVFDNLANLELLNLQRNRLTSLPNGVFDDLSSLKVLSLNINELDSLPGGTFAGLSELEQLYLGDNELTSLPEDAFDDATGLRRLWMNNNKIKSLPVGVFDDLSSLEELSLHDNDLESLPEEAFANLAKLKKLWLNYNDLESLPEEIFDNLDNLEFLEFYDNDLWYLPRGLFENLAKVRELNMSNNELRTLPEGIFEGMLSLDRLVADLNPGSPFVLTAKLEKSGSDAVIVKVAQGSPFDMDVTLNAHGGLLSVGGATAATTTTVTVETGTTASEPIRVVLGPDQAEAKVSVQSSVFRLGEFWGIQTDVGESLVFGAVPQRKNAPTIVGQPQVGQVLTASTSTIGDIDRLTNATFSYQWLRNDGNNDTDIAGATESTYTLTEDDEGRTIKVAVSFTDGEGNPETLTSDPTTEVEAKPNTRATGAPTIDGAARVGETLTADTSGIADEDRLTNVAFAYQWIRRDGSGDAVITAATGSTYTLVAADEGMTIKVKVSFTDDEGNPETLTSEPTGAVAPDPGPLTVFTVVDASTDPDTLLGALVDEGTLILGNPTGGEYGIRVDTDSNDDIHKVELALSGAKDVSRPEKHSPYSLYGDSGEDNLDGGNLPAGSYTLTATAHRANGDVLGTLTVSFTVEAQEQTAVPNNDPTGQPTIGGFARVGETLTADTSGIDDDDGLTNVAFSYQWVRSDGGLDSNIQDATGSSYTLTGDDEGRTIKVTVSFTDGEGNPESLTSDPTGEVAPASGPLTAFTVVDTSTDPDKVLGTLEDGGTLTLAAPAGDSYGIRVDTESNDDIQKVELALSRAKTEGKTEWEPPYSLYGDSGEENLTGEDLPAGSYDLTATAYKQNGDVLGTLKVSFSVAYAAPAEEEPPAQNTLATGAPTIDGIARVGGTLTADVSGIRDDDDVTQAVFAYQWLRGDAEIAGATGSSYTLVEADEGHTIKVTVSFTDGEGNPETLTSDPSGSVEAKPNKEATGAPTIDGIARVGETLTADTSGIDDDDGLDNVAFSYQWVRNDGGSDTNIQDATELSYTLTGDDEGKTIKVKVSFTDAQGNPETLTSDATGVVEATETVPGRPQELDGEASAQGVNLTWKAPSGSSVTQYVVYRGKLQNGSMNGRPMTKYATIDATGADMAYTDGDVEAGAEYRYRVAAVNSAGEGKKSNWLDIAAGDSE